MSTANCSYYSVSIFCKVGVDGFIGSIALFVVVFISQIISALIIDKSGRKPLLLVGSIVAGTLLVVTGVLIQVFDLEGGEDLSTAQKVTGYFVIVLICLVTAVYEITYSTCSWVVVNEIYPLRVRGIGAALSQLGWWSGTFLMGEIGPILLSSSLKTPGTFYLFAGMYSLAALHVLLFLPETKGRSLESIQWLFSEPWSRRVNVFYYIRCGCFCCGGRLGMGWTLADSDKTGVGVAAAADKEREVLQAVFPLKLGIIPGPGHKARSKGDAVTVEGSLSSHLAMYACHHPPYNLLTAVQFKYPI